MRLRHIFRRTRPTPPPTRIDPGEAMVISWFGFTEEQWAALDNPVRANYRNLYMKAIMP